MLEQQMFIVQQHCTQREFGISEYLRGRLIAKIEWVPLLKTEKLLWVMRKTGKTALGHFLLNSTVLKNASKKTTLYIDSLLVITLNYYQTCHK